MAARLGAALVGALVVAATAGCGTEEPVPPTLPGEEEPPCELSSRTFLLDQLLAPTTLEEHSDLRFAPPHHPGLYPTNRLGFTRYGLIAAGAPLEEALSDLMAEDGLVWAATVETCADASSDHLRFGMSRAEIVSRDELDNPRIRILDTLGPPAVGVRTESGFEVILGRTLVPLAPLFDVDASTTPASWTPAFLLVASGTLEEDRIDARLGFAIHDEDIYGQEFLSALARSATLVINQDPGCPEACSTDEAAVILSFDADRDMRVTPEEISSHSGRGFFLGPDYNLVAKEGDAWIYWPDHDRQLDHTVLGMVARGALAGL